MKKLLYCCLVLLALACKQRFDPPVTTPPNGYLVIDGIINSGNGPTNIRLSRAISLSDTSRVKYERNAQVRVEGENNTSFTLPETAQGLYSAASLPLAAGVKYRLYVRTTDGKEYNSDYTSAIKTPPIDNIRWEQPSDLTFFINTHDPQNKTRYYRWEWEETWEFHSAYTTTLKYLRNSFGEITGIDYLYPNMNYDTNNYVCWKTEFSTNLLIGSSAKLAKDSIDLPIHFIPFASEKVSQLYSILVRQYALSKAGYEFLQKMKKNTEQTGTLFDAQPSELKGNLHSKNNPNEIVIGYVEVCDMQEMRIFVKPTDLQGWNYRSGCMEQKVPNNADSIRAYSYLHPTNVAELSPTGDILSYYASGTPCVLCTTKGVHFKPSFWPR